MNRMIGCTLALLALPASLSGQTLSQRITALGEGNLRLSFAAREGVCGSSHGISITTQSDEWVGDCARGPVRVSLRVRSGRLTEAHTYVGGRWRAPQAHTIDLGMLPARSAASELLALAEASSADADDLITAATLADSATVWPTLLRIARARTVPVETRRQAVFWLGQAAGEAAVRGLDSIVVDTSSDLEVRKQAVFALSQRPADEGVPALISVARTSRHPELRKTALFWLGQSEDPRALALFEEILR
ncbi:MAG: HEAT repeat domain-containing protein [Gemmatimonadales bacterium]